MLEFQRRVLEEAQDETNPLLERVKFLSIVGSNLDEFFMVRVAGLKKQVEVGVHETPPDGMSPAEQLAAIRKTALQLMSQARECLRDDILPQLNKAGIHVLDYQQLSERQKVAVDGYFDEVVFPVLTPLAFDPGHPFPHISNLSLNLAVVIEDERGHELFARIKGAGYPATPGPDQALVGQLTQGWHHPIPSLFCLAGAGDRRQYGQAVPGMKILEVHPFRVTRDADTVIQELEAGDLLETMEQSVRQRRFGDVVRVTVNDIMPARIQEILIENLELDPKDIYPLEGPLGLSNVMPLHSIDRYDLKDTPFKQSIPVVLRNIASDSDIFAAIRNHDILLHHPYDSFTPVVDFLNQAARDPDVLAIKQTLYRVGRNSPVVNALLEAREYGKQVAVLVELKARFDEESNIGWARMLEQEGVHVIYGLLGLKTHSKIALVVRKEGEHIRRYLHLATGNYNAITAQIYEDIGMFTCDDEIGADATDLFNYLTGYSAKKDYRKLLVAPVNLRSGMEALDPARDSAPAQARQRPADFQDEFTGDPAMIKALYQASAGRGEDRSDRARYVLLAPRH